MSEELFKSKYSTFSLNVELSRKSVLAHVIGDVYLFFEMKTTFVQYLPPPPLLQVLKSGQQSLWLTQGSLH